MSGPMLTCLGCGQQFWRRKTGHDSRKYHSRACAFAHWRQIRLTDIRSLCAQSRPAEPSRLCERCFQPVARRRKYCVPCGKVQRAEAGRQTTLAYTRAKRGVRVIPHTCPSCGELFTAPLGRVFCKLACRKQGRNVAKGLRLVGRSVDDREQLAALAALAHAGYQRLDELQNPDNPCRSPR